MLTTVFSAATYGINAYLIEIETNIENTVPNFFMVGLPDNAVKESRERVATAIKNSAYAYPNKRSPSILRLPMLKRKVLLTTCRLPLACLPPAAKYVKIVWKSLLFLVNFRWKGQCVQSWRASYRRGNEEKRNPGIILPKQNANEAGWLRVSTSTALRRNRCCWNLEGSH